MERTRKKRNPFVSYFKSFGLKQVCDLIMLAGGILLIVGLCTTDMVLLAAFICYSVGALGSIALCAKIMLKTPNHRDPSYKTAFTNLIIMSVLVVLAVVGIVLVFVL